MAGEARAPPKPSSRIGFADRAPVRIRPFCRLISASCATQHGRITPRLVELQAFPSLYGFQTALADAYRDTYAHCAGVVRVFERTDVMRAIAR